VFLGVGAQQSRRISLEGCNTPDVLWGVEFLRQVAEGREIELQDSVVVIGGGNVAVDVALTAVRWGVVDVKMTCLEGLNEMPAGAWEIEGAKAEGVQILPCWGPDKIISEDGKVTGMDIVECTAVFDEQGNFCPEFSDKKECILVDQVILAVGQAADLSFLDENSPVKVNRGLIVVDEETRIKGFQEIAVGYSDETAVKEAGRCLQCDLRLHLRCNSSPPAHWLPFDEEHIRQLPETEGVFQLLDADHQIVAIKGTANLRQDLLEALADNDTASFFEFEEDKMFSQRESELIQKYLQEHGEMPGGGADNLDDLF